MYADGNKTFNKGISAAQIDNALYDIRKKLFKTTPVDECDRLMSPLNWYVNTGRAPLAFVEALCYATNTQKTTIAKKLAQGGSDMEVVERIKKYLKIK